MPPIPPPSAPRPPTDDDWDALAEAIIEMFEDQDREGRRAIATMPPPRDGTSPSGPAEDRHGQRIAN